MFLSSLGAIVLTLNDAILFRIAIWRVVENNIVSCVYKHIIMRTVMKSGAEEGRSLYPRLHPIILFGGHQRADIASKIKPFVSIH
jgi:hypothetical protein